MAYSARLDRSGLLGENHIKETASSEAVLGGRCRKRPRELTGSDLADIVRLIERKLAWYGFTSVKVGPFMRVKGRKVLIDLIDHGEVLCRLELDPGTTPADGQGLATLMNSLQGEPRRRMREINPTA